MEIKVVMLQILKLLMLYKHDILLWFESLKNLEDSYGKSCWLASHTYALSIDRITLVLLDCYLASRVPLDFPGKIGKRN